MEPDGDVKQVNDESAAVTDDVEGHNFGPAVVGALVTWSHGRQREIDRRRDDEPLAPLSKPFPRMRDKK